VIRRHLEAFVGRHGRDPAFLGVGQPVREIRQPLVDNGLCRARLFRIGELPVGVYKITFDLSGFTTLIRDELRLPVGFDAKVDAVMKIGSLEESVTVTGGSPVIDLTTTTKSVTLNTEILNEIPRGRDLSMVYSMAPGVTLAGTPDVGGSNMANRQNISAGGVALQPKLPRWAESKPRDYTIVQTLLVKKAPAGAVIHITCLRTGGKSGCPFKAKKLLVKLAGTATLTKYFKNRHLRVKTKLKIFVTKTGFVGKGVIYTMRPHKKPSVLKI